MLAGAGHAARADLKELPSALPAALDGPGLRVLVMDAPCRAVCAGGPTACGDVGDAGRSADIGHVMYSAILTVHSYLRYAVLLLVLLVVLRYVAGLLSSRAWNDGDEAIGRWMIRVWDLQFLLGLVLYFLSPIVQFGFVNFGEAMGNAQLRQYLIEHPLLNLLAIAVLHVGWVRAARADDDRGRMVRALVFIAVAVLLVVLSIPWSGRPLLRTTIAPPQLF